MKSVKSFILVVLCVLFMGGCASQQIIVPDGCENSILYFQFGNELNEIDMVLRVANIAAIHEDVYTKAEAIKVIDNLLVILEGETTYLDFAVVVWDLVSDINERNEMEILMVSTIIMESFDLPIPIDPCDKGLIVGHLKKQKKLVMMLN